MDKKNRLVLALQGGGALGAYQAGVLEGIHQAGAVLDEICAVSIGAVNAAIFLGNQGDNRIRCLRQFWDIVTIPDFAGPADWPSWLPTPEPFRHAYARAHAEMQNSQALAIGVPGFFTRRMRPPYIFGAGSPASASLFDTTPLSRTLRDICDFELVNSNSTRLAVVTSDVQTGQAHYFDTAERTLSLEMVMASGAVPPWFPAVEIEGAWFWDGALVTASPIRRLYANAFDPTTALRVDLWRSDGPAPDALPDVEIRLKNIDQASRSAYVAEVLSEEQHLRQLLAYTLSQVAPEARQSDAQLAEAAVAAAQLKPLTVVSLDYNGSSQERHFKDGQFGRDAISYHWEQGRLAFERAWAGVAEALEKTAEAPSLQVGRTA